MTTQSVKGLLKGLRYISQIFDEKEEGNIEIGFPTDVKHVAHIGSDGPSNAQPTWMNEFSDTSKDSKQQPPPPSTQAPEASTQGNGQQNVDQTTLDSPTRRRKSNKKQSRRQSSSDGGLILESASRELIANPTTTTTTPTTTKPRRHKTTSSGESPAGESSTTATPTTRNAKAPTHKKKTGSDKLPKPKTRGSRSSGQGSSDVTNEMALELVAEEGS